VHSDGVMAHNGGDGTSRRGGVVRGRDHSERGQSGIELCRAVSAGEEGERTVAGGDRAEAKRGEGEEVADRQGRLVIERESGGESGLTGGVGSSARERELAGRAGARAKAGRRWAEGGESQAWGEGGHGFGPRIGPARGERFLLFYFNF
jgi:hypothetical protein